MEIRIAAFMQTTYFACKLPPNGLEKNFALYAFNQEELPECPHSYYPVEPPSVLLHHTFQMGLCQLVSFLKEKSHPIAGELRILDKKIKTVQKATVRKKSGAF